MLYSELMASTKPLIIISLILFMIVFFVKLIIWKAERKNEASKTFSKKRKRIVNK